MDGREEREHNDRRRMNLLKQRDSCVLQESANATCRKQTLPIGSPSLGPILCRFIGLDSKDSMALTTKHFYLPNPILSSVESLVEAANRCLGASA